jgi:hypothetical protein
MPYKTKYVKGAKRPWKIVNTDRNEIVGSSTTKANAEASIRARMMAEENPEAMNKKYVKSRKKATKRGK